MKSQMPSPKRNVHGPGKVKRATKAKQPAEDNEPSAVKSTAVENTPQLRRLYKRNFLSQVIARIDFATPMSELRTGAPPVVLKALRTRFPIAEQKQETANRWVVGPTSIEHRDVEIFKWYYHAKDRSRHVYIGQDAMYVNYLRYDRFEELKKDFAVVTDALYAQYDYLQVKRLGLRYVDNITLPNEKRPTEWSKYIQPDLLGSFNLVDDPATLSRSFHIVEFNYGAEMRMRFQYGMPNEDYPAPIRKKTFVLDYDAYCELLISQQEMHHYLKLFHDKIKVSFEQVITDALRKLMGPIDGK